jgi:hypothetical protein
MDSRDNKGRFVKGSVPWSKGLHGTYHTIPASEERKKKISAKLKGRCLSPNTCFQKGHKSVWKGKSRGPMTEEHKQKICTGRKGIIPNRIYIKGIHNSINTEFKKGEMSGPKSPSWQGGISFEPYTTDWNKTLKRSIRERDRYTCKNCGEPQGDRALCVHHIDYNKKNCNPNNLISLCLQCHIRTNRNREKWIEFFKPKSEQF